VILTAQLAQGATYYWDSNSNTSGWGTAVGGIWAEPTTSRWTTGTNTTTATDASRTILLADSVNFGDGSANALTGGTITVSGTVDATGITFGSSAGQIILDGGIINLAAAASITVNNATDTITSEISGAGTSLSKAGTGTLVLTGSSTYTGSTIINAGTLNLGGGTANGSLASTVLTLNGGAINYTRTGNTTQGFTSTNINAGVNSITVVSGNILNLGTIVRGAGGTLDFNNVGAGIVAALAANNDATGIMAGFTYGDSWAVSNGAGVGISGLADGSYTLSSVAGVAATSYLNGNIDVDSSTGALDAAITANSLRFSAAAANTMTLTGTTNIITSGGILVGSLVGNNLSTITGGTLAGANTKDLLIMQNNTLGGLTISSGIGNNTGATALVKSGAGRLTLSGSNTFTGGLVINAGTVALGNTGALFSTAGSENNVTFGSGSTGILAMNGTSLVIRSLNSNASNAGTTFVENGNATPATLTIGNLANAVSSYYGVIRDGTGGGALTITKVGTGALNIGTSNTYTGGTNLNGATSFTFRPGMFGAGTITVNANTTMDVDYGAFSTYTNALHVTGGVTLTTTGSTQYFGQTFTGAVSGSGTIKTAGSGNDANSREKLGLTSASNTFTGTLLNEGGSAIINVNSLGDGGKIQLKAGTGGFQLGAGTATSLLFNTRQVELFGSSAIRNDNASAAITFTVNTTLAYNGAGVRTLSLEGSNTGNNAFNGSIGNNGADAVTVTKAGTGRWTLSGANTYTGATGVSAGTLEVTSIANGGSASSIGASSNAAGNLILNGGTLRYTGGAVSTDRLFSLQASTTLDASGTGAVNFTNTASIGYNGGTAAKTLTLTGASTGNNTISAVIGDNTGATSLVKNGIGTWILGGASNSFTGTTTLNTGKLVLDYAASNTTKLANGAALTLGGGTVELSGGSHTEVVASTTLTNNTGTIIAQTNSGSSVIQLGTINRSNGGSTLSFSADNIATTNNTNTNEILGPGYTVGSHWAVNSTNLANGSIVALSSYTTTVPTITGVNTANYQLTGSQNQTGTTVGNTLRIVNSAADDVLNLNTFNFDLNSTNGVMAAMLYAGGSNNSYTINGSGAIKAATGNNHLGVNVFTGTLAVNALLNSGSANTTKWGAGTLVIGSNNSGLSGAHYVQEGTLRLANNGATGTTAGGIVVSNGATLELSNGVAIGAEALTISGYGISSAGALRNLAGNNSSYAGAITLNTATSAGGARINSDSTGTLTLTGGVVTSLFNDVTFGGAGNTTVSTAVISGAGGLIKDGAGTTTLTAANTYTGATRVSNGILSIGTIATPTGSINSSALTIDGGNFRNNSATNYTGALTFTSGTISGTNWGGSLSNLTIGTNQTISPGNSPGTATLGAQTWAAGGSYVWEINNVSGTAGLDPGWDLINGSAALTITAASGGNEFSIDVMSLTLANAAGTLTGFNDATNYNWLIADFLSISGFDTSDFIVDTTQFAVHNSFTGSFGVALGDSPGIGGDNSQIWLTYTAIPEPKTAFLGVLGVLLILRRRR
jgi:fibronectin-binding autotransporter adhesin